jgi:diaminopimelate epimerase
MKKKVEFTKMVAAGNDFVIIENSCHLSAVSGQLLARKICDRKYGIGADGLLFLEKSKITDVKMRIFNPDGSEAEMCGNGARCAALYSAREERKISIETKAGIIESRVDGNNIKIKLTEPKDIKLDISLKLNKRKFKANFVDLGVPHAVIFVEGLDGIQVSEIGRAIRNHKKFAPRGANVDFVEVLSDNSIKIRTYERGVEDETFACGTGSVASALLYALRSTLCANHKINVHTKSGEILRVYFRKTKTGFRDIWLEGKAKIVYKGVYYV